MSTKYAWSQHSDDELWRGGPCDSIKECVEEALDEGYELTDTFAIGLIEDYKIGIDFAQDIVERLCEDAFDEVGEASDRWLDSAKKPELDILNNRVTEVVNQWLEEIHEKPSFFKVLPCEECTLQEALDIHNEKVKNSVKGGKL